MKQRAEPVVSGNIRRSDRKKTLLKFKNQIILVVFILVIIIIGVLVWENASSNKIAYGYACTKGSGAALIQQASKQLQRKDNINLSATMYKIEDQKCYKNDPNCMYILTAYSTNIGDKQGTKQNIAQFNKVYNGSNVSSTLTKYKS